MSKKASKDAINKDVDTSEDTLEQSLQVLSAKKLFFVSSINMGWQLAGVVVLPVFVGVKLDQRFNSSPSCTLAALVFAIGGAVIIVKNTLRQVNSEQEEQSRRDKESAK